MCQKNHRFKQKKKLIIKYYTRDLIKYNKNDVCLKLNNNNKKLFLLLVLLFSSRHIWR